MLRYYSQWWNDFFSPLSQANIVPEVGVDVAQEGNRANPECAVVVSNYSQTISSSSQATLPTEVNNQTVIASLHGAKEWIQTQRQCLNSLIEEGSLQKVEELLQASLDEIKTITELYLGRCESRIYHIQGKHEAYDALAYLYKSQSQLKPLLQGGMLLFHPDHVLNLTHSQAMRELITRYSQSYLEQSRCYLDRFKDYHLRIEEFYQQSQKELQRQQSHRDWSELARRIQELGQSLKDLEQSFKDFAKKLSEVEAKRAQDKEAMEKKLKENEDQLKENKEAIEKKLKEFEAKLDKLFTPTQQQAPTPPPAADAEMPGNNNTHLFRH